MTIITLDNIAQITERKTEGKSEFGPYRGKTLTLTDEFGHVFQIAILYAKEFKEVK